MGRVLVKKETMQEAACVSQAVFSTMVPKWWLLVQSESILIQAHKPLKANRAVESGPPDPLIDG